MAATMIGGAFLSATLQTLVEKLASTEFLDYIRNTKLDVSLLRKLQTTLLTLQAVLDDAEERQINNLAVKKWLDDLKDVVLDAEDLVNEISYDSLRCKMENTKAGNRTNKVWNFLSSPFKNFYRDINSQLKIMCETLEPFAQHKDTLGLQTKSARVSRRPPSSSGVNESVMVGRNEDKDTIIKMLVSDSDCGTSKNNNLGVVAILGMGGVGKTTLAQLVYNNEKVEQHFDFKVWVCVSEDFDVVRVTKSLLESVVRNTTFAASKVWESDNLDILRVELNKITRKKRFLFVLDDLWNDSYNDWDELVSPLVDGNPGSSVIITTRQQKVAEMAKTFPIYKLDPLSHEDCWSILSKHALGSDEYHARKNTALEEIGRKIARKCGGLPIAAKTLGGLLRSRVDTTEWTEILNSDVWNLPNDNIIPALHLSYRYLPSHLKRCFAYCSIFPKDYPLDRKQLVLLWMGEGFLDYSHEGKLLEEVGDGCFAELLSRSLIQQSNDGARGTLFVMHDLINDLATSVSGKICSRPECGDIPEKVRHLSYNQEAYDIFMNFKHFYNLKCLRSFLPISSNWFRATLSIKVVDDLLPTFKRLRVLSLSKYVNITKLPDSICNLVQLRYLDLSFTKIKSLPDTVCNLYNLQTLNLLGCYSLTELPVHMGNLISLRHLDISGTAIKELPMEIGELENLQTLTVFLVGKRREGLSIKELRKFPNLQGKFTIKNLNNIIDAKEAEDANLKNKEKIEKLELIWGKQSEDSLKVKIVLEMLQPPINLKSLVIDLYGGTRFPNWLGNSSFSNMVSIDIRNCEYCMTLPPLGQLPSLKKLSISNLLLLETIGPEFYCVEEGECSSSTFQPFPSLEHMKFHSMPNWKDWISFEGINFAFPRLRTMELHNCPELRGDLPDHLSCMEEIKIGGCYKLLETTHTLNWLSTIKIVTIKEDFNHKVLSTDSPFQHAAAAESYPMFISKMMVSSICLTHLELWFIQSLTAFPTNGLPTSLQSLSIHSCSKLSFMPFETFQNYTSLVRLDMWECCDSLTSFPLDGFPALQTLCIHRCRSMNSIFISESPSRRQSTLRSLQIISVESLKVNLRLDTLTNLERLDLCCPGELSFCEGVCLPPKLQTIDISFGRTKPHVKEWGLQHLTALSRLVIREKGKMDNILRIDSMLPVSLVTLYVGGNIFFEGNGLRHLFSLENLHFHHCQHLKSLQENCLPSSLKSLQFSFCKQLESLPEDNLPSSLKKLTIRECPLLEERYKRKENWSKIAHIPDIQINLQVTI
ncbi:putative disease resistance RPP13-like protein 1 [Vicia villosa]|uniref:putative disease resistance RPP13-like protein 1 n=1 Tax=Vicia villosa TaxID=3911 RepID=UPI00273C7CB7|nr:putative disease resistance RPP13-like protein 1 [Vicia villosa]XP_058788536.1 putative disease resistance RPP13-like protein 1 [Vicia villosa]